MRYIISNIERMNNLFCPQRRKQSRYYNLLAYVLVLTCQQDEAHCEKKTDRITRGEMTCLLTRSIVSVLEGPAWHFDLVWKQQLKHSNVYVIYLDFTKSFAKIDHGTIWRKLHEFVIAEILGVWLRDFLKGRHQTVTAYCTLSGVSNESLSEECWDDYCLKLVSRTFSEPSSHPHSSTTPMKQWSIEGVKDPTNILRVQNDLNTICDWLMRIICSSMVQNFKHFTITHKQSPVEAHMTRRQCNPRVRTGVRPGRPRAIRYFLRELPFAGGW